MPAAAIQFSPVVPALRKSSHRAVGFLIGDPELTAQAVFYGLPENVRRYILDSMDHWIAGNDLPASRFHGFPNRADFYMCFVYKAKEKRKGHRLYGYLCHPQVKTNPSFLLCVLCRHTTKSEWETDLGELAKVKNWSMSKAAAEAIVKEYPDNVVSIDQGRKTK